MFDTNGEQESVKPKSSFSTYISEGDRLFLKKSYVKAIDSYTKALTLKPDDKNCLVSRSKCYLNMGDSESALRDAEASLKADKVFVKGLYQKAEALYNMGEFEFALVFYHRGQKLRPLQQEFRRGIQKAQEAIENSVGSHSSVNLHKKRDVSFHQGSEVSTSPPSGAVQPVMMEKRQQRQKTSNSDRTDKKLLGEFYSDRKYLKNLLKDEALQIKGNQQGGERLQELIMDSITFLDTRTRFWHQQRPIYARNRDLKLMQQKQSKLMPSDPAEFLLKSQLEISEALACGNVAGSLKKAKEVIKTVQGWSEKVVPNKKEVLGSLHSCIGDALMDMGDVEKALKHHCKAFELAQQCNLPDEISRALDSIGCIYAQSGKFSKAIEFWEKKLPLVQSALEKTWLCHEIGWCYLKLKLYKEARDYGVRSLAAADEAADEKWKLNANVLVAQSEINLKNFESCVAYFERALSHAKAVEDDSAIDAIQKALNEVEQHLTQ